MTFEEVSTIDAVGLVLAVPVLQQSGRKVMAKGRRLAPDDVRLLMREGTPRVWVVRLDPDEVDESAAVQQVAAALTAGPLQIEVNAGGRATLVAARTVALNIDRDRVNQVNAGRGAMVATLPQWSLATPGEAVATVKSRPFGVHQTALDASLQPLLHGGPAIEAHPVINNRVTVIYCDPVNPRRAQELLAPVLDRRMAKFGLRPQTLVAQEETGALRHNLRRALENQPQIILVASTIAPSAPEDAIGQAMLQAGASIENFMAPVDPGMLLLLGYAGNTAILTAPSCLRSKGPDVLDLLLPPLLAGIRITEAEIAAQGVGGLLARPAKPNQPEQA